MDDVTIKFEVFDGKFRTTATVLCVHDKSGYYLFYSGFFSVRLIDFNLAPVVTLTQDELLYTEGHPPSFLPNGSVTVTDPNDVNMTG